MCLFSCIRFARYCGKMCSCRVLSICDGLVSTQDLHVPVYDNAGMIFWVSGLMKRTVFLVTLKWYVFDNLINGGLYQSYLRVCIVSSHGSKITCSYSQSTFFHSGVWEYSS